MSPLASGSFPFAVNNTENGADPVAEGLTESSVHTGDLFVVVVGVGDPPPPTPGVGVADGIVVTLGIGLVSVVQASELITILDGLVVDRTFSVGSSVGARENALDF